MPVGIDYYKAIQGGLGVDSYPQSEVREAKDRIRSDLVASLNYDEINATRNGVQQGFLVTTTEYGYQGQVRALPGDELNIGDLIGFAGEDWIVTDVTPVNPFYRMGIMKLCKHNEEYGGTRTVLPHIHNHMFRHTFATRMYESGVSLKAMQTVLGHSTISVTMDIYTDASEEFVKEQLKTCFSKHMVNTQAYDQIYDRLLTTYDNL